MTARSIGSVVYARKKTHNVSRIVPDRSQFRTAASRAFWFIFSKKLTFVVGQEKNFNTH